MKKMEEEKQTEEEHFGSGEQSIELEVNGVKVCVHLTNTTPEHSVELAIHLLDRIKENKTKSSPGYTE